MTQALVQSLVMHALASPQFLGQVRGEGAPPGLSADGRAVVAALDCEKLYLFGGFLTRVQNGPLRLQIPGTLELLARLDLEIDLFAAYRERFLSRRARGPLSDEQRLDAFAAFLDRFIEGHAWRDLIRAGLAHERAIFDLVTAPAAEDPRAPFGETTPGPEAVPVIRGRLRLADFACDPDALMRWLGAEAGVPEGADRDRLRRPVTMLYWCREADAPHVAIPVDAATSALFRAIDGRRTGAAIAAIAAIEAAVDAAMPAAILDKAVEQGLVGYDRAEDHR